MSQNRMDIGPALRAVRERIERAKHGGAPAVRIVAVTKGFGPDAVAAALESGLSDIGENYYQEAAEKFRTVVWPANATRHFIGRLQRNKARRIAELFDVVQTVDDLEIAAVLERGAQAANKVLEVLIQVNVAEDERQGVAPDMLGEFARLLTAYPHLRLRGLMAMGPAGRDAAEFAFCRAAACFDRLRSEVSGATVLSMGMSDDMDLALACGSTMLRLGTSLFGPRTYP